MKFKKGDLVVEVLPAPVSGMVTKFDVDQETGAVQLLVEWADANGDMHGRFFKESELAAAPV